MNFFLGLYTITFLVLFMTYCPILALYDNRVFCCKKTSLRRKPDIFLEMGVCFFWPREKKWPDLYDTIK